MFHPRGVTRHHVTKAYRDSGLNVLQPERRLVSAQLRPYKIRDRVCSTTLQHLPGENPSDYVTSNPM